MVVWGLASLKTMGQTGRLEILVRIDGIVYSANSAGQQMEPQSGFLCCILENFSYFGEPQCFPEGLHLIG